jgi:soluble lytic murein transglycosylase-like protein
MPVFDIWAARYGVPPDLLKATTWLESGWQSDVVSSTGAVGIGQLMPVTVDMLNDLMGTDLSPWVPADNIRLSARNLRFLLDYTGGDTAHALAGYYQGLGSVDRNGLYPSTLAYINGVLELRSRFD